MGLGTAYVNPEKRIRNKTLRQNVLAKKLREENLAEELRVLYVALTRAREKLILTAAVDNAEEKWNTAREHTVEQLGYADYMEAGSYMDFLMPILAGTTLQVKVIGAEQLAMAELDGQLQLSGRMDNLRYAAEYADEDMMQKLRGRLSFVYPYGSLEKLYTKTTVSELKVAAMEEKDEAAYHMFEEREVVPYIPAFRRTEEKVSGTVRGSAFHRAMELLDFEALFGRQFAELPADYESYRRNLDTARLAADLRSFLEQETVSLRLSTEYYQALNQGKLVHFLQTALAYRMWAAQCRGELYREQPFVLGIGAERLSEEFPAEEKVLIQGIIDVFFIENGEMVLLDYKTDIIDTMEALWNRYEVQLTYYQEALESLMSMPVKEKVLYSFYLEKC
jgi:ATP-dependent helicase/nuclease subunit A